MKLIDKTTWKFFCVGVVNTVIGTGTMLFCYNCFHLRYWTSTGINYVTGSIVSYFLNKYYTFQNQDRSYKTVLRFIMNILICYLISYGIAKPLAAKILSDWTVSIQENGAMLIGLAIFGVINYLGQRFYVFRKRESIVA